MRYETRLLMLAGLCLELLLALFPPMRATLVGAQGGLVQGRTHHFFAFSHLGGAWTIDTGRFTVYAFLVATAVGLCVVVESWIHSERARTSTAQK